MTTSLETVILSVLSLYCVVNCNIFIARLSLDESSIVSGFTLVSSGVVFCDDLQRISKR